MEKNFEEEMKEWRKEFIRLYNRFPDRQYPYAFLLFALVLTDKQFNLTPEEKLYFDEKGSQLFFRIVHDAPEEEDTVDRCVEWLSKLTEYTIGKDYASINEPINANTVISFYAINL